MISFYKKIKVEILTIQNKIINHAFKIQISKILSNDNYLKIIIMSQN